MHRISVEEANQLISRLNVKKILCKGNHDKNYEVSVVLIEKKIAFR